jgi:hypothetical protein
MGKCVTGNETISGYRALHYAMALVEHQFWLTQCYLLFSM